MAYTFMKECVSLHTNLFLTKKSILNDSRRYTNSRTVGRHILVYNSICADFTIISDCYAANNLSTCINSYIIAQFWVMIPILTNSYLLIKCAIIADFHTGANNQAVIMTDYKLFADFCLFRNKNAILDHKFFASCLLSKSTVTDCCKSDQNNYPKIRISII